VELKLSGIEAIAGGVSRTELPFVASAIAVIFLLSFWYFWKRS
jgi:hypothetical protein